MYARRSRYDTARCHYSLRGVNTFAHCTGLSKDSGTKINVYSYSTTKGLHFLFVHLFSRIKFLFDSAQSVF